MDYTTMLFDKYGTALLSTKQTSQVTTRSVASLESDRREHKGIPFKRTGDSDNSPVRYGIGDISTWLNQTEKVV